MFIDSEIREYKKVSAMGKEYFYSLSLSSALRA
jgi:hypothetical protein